MWCTIPASTFLRRLVALGAGLLVAMLLAVLGGALPVAQATHAPTCLERHPTNPVVPGPGGGTILGTSGNDVLAGGPGNDLIQGLGGGFDRLCGNGGADFIEGGEGYDRIDGGPQNDALGGFDASPFCLAPQDQPVGQIDATSKIFGGDGNDFIMGAAGDPSFPGGLGDGIFSEAGNDCIMALEGPDFIRAGSDQDTIFAGDGDDQAAGEDANDLIIGGNGHDDLYASTVFTGPIPEFPQTCFNSGELIGVNGPADSGQQNNLDGGAGIDLLVGSTTDDRMLGGLNGDDLYGFAGPDSLAGQAGADCLSGGPQNDVLLDADPTNTEPNDKDVLWGAEAADTLNATDGDALDTVNGGSGTDTCFTDPGEVRISCNP